MITNKNLSKHQKALLLEYRKGKVALKQLREITKLLNDAGIPEFVTVGEDLGNAPQMRLKWFLMRRKDVKPTEVCKNILTPEELRAIELLVPYGQTVKERE